MMSTEDAMQPCLQRTLAAADARAGESGLSFHLVLAGEEEQVSFGVPSQSLICRACGHMCLVSFGQPQGHRYEAAHLDCPLPSD